MNSAVGSIKRNTKHYLMLLPFFAVFLIFFLWPLLYGASISFTKWNGIKPPIYVGFDNYIKVLSSPDLYASAKNLVLFMVSTLIVGISISLFISLVASQLSLKFSYFFRSVFFIPNMMPLFLSAAIWRWLLQPEYGPLNVMLTKVGFPNINWFFTSGYAIASVVLVDLWRASGWNILIIMTCILEIPSEYYEAAEVDGANAWQKMRYITLPQLEPIIFLIITNGMIGALQIFDIPWFMSASNYNIYGGQNNNFMLYPVMQVYGLAFGKQNFGGSSAYAMLLLITTLIITGLRFVLRHKKD
jgi:multiple sugar transport system permease protein